MIVLEVKSESEYDYDQDGRGRQKGLSVGRPAIAVYKTKTDINKKNRSNARIAAFEAEAKDKILLSKILNVSSWTFLKDSIPILKFLKNFFILSTKLDLNDAQRTTQARKILVSFNLA